MPRRCFRRLPCSSWVWSGCRRLPGWRWRGGGAKRQNWRMVTRIAVPSASRSDQRDNASRRVQVKEYCAVEGRECLDGDGFTSDFFDYSRSLRPKRPRPAATFNLRPRRPYRAASRENHPRILLPTAFMSRKYMKVNRGERLVDGTKRRRTRNGRSRYVSTAGMGR